MHNGKLDTSARSTAAGVCVLNQLQCIQKMGPVSPCQISLPGFCPCQTRKSSGFKVRHSQNKSLKKNTILECERQAEVKW